MAIGRNIQSFDVFLKKVKEVSTDRYELWTDGEEFSLEPIVTSVNVHTYTYFPDTDEEAEQIEDAWKGKLLRFTEIIHGKW